MNNSTYNHTIEYLFKLQRVGIKLGFDNINILLKKIGDPHKELACIHIAGTNGKGSTAAMLESILRNAGHKTGLYTSPHLIDFTERIQINRKPISKSIVIDYTEFLKPTIEEITPSFFEVTTAIAFRHFIDQKVDIAIIETGMGGRLDSTTVVNPLLTVITPIGLDHQFYLGDSLAEIAGEKAGIIKPKIPCLSTNTHPKVLPVLQKICTEKKAPFINVNVHGSVKINQENLTNTLCDILWQSEEFKNITLGIPGRHQTENALLAIAVATELKKHFSISKNAVLNGLNTVSWRGRLSLVSESPMVLVDVSHNPAGMEKTFKFLSQFYTKNQINVLTFLQSDKDYQKIGDVLISNSTKIEIVDLPLGKPLSPKLFLDYFYKNGKAVNHSNDLQASLNNIWSSPLRQEVWIIIGSHFLAGEVFSWIDSQNI